MDYEKEKPAQVYLCYVSYKSEVDTKDFMRFCLAKGKTLFVPKVLRDGRLSERGDMGSVSHKSQSENLNEICTKPTEMEFYRISSLEELQKGYQGILEPAALPERSFHAWRAGAEKREALSLRMLLPGAVFDRSGNRIGYGGGFYDRWLAKWWAESAEYSFGTFEKIGLAYGIQIAQEIPADPLDQKVDAVITEKQILYSMDGG